MLDGIDLTQLDAILRVGGGGALFVWATLWLIRRGDGLQKENIDELRRQRDDWRKRAERAEERISRHIKRGCDLTSEEDAARSREK